MKRHRKDRNGQLVVNFYDPIAGKQSEKLTVTQDDWQAFSEKRWFEPGTKPDVRELAAQAVT